MYAIDEETGRQEAVTINVRDAARSQEFYQDLFGLVMHEQTGPLTMRVLRSPDVDAGMSIILRTSRDTSDGPLWLSVEVGSISEVLDLYLLAIMMGANALLPRKRGQRWSTVVTDPDGNRVSVWTRVGDEEQQERSSAMAMRPQPWEWRLAPQSEAPKEDEFDRDCSHRRMRDHVPSMPGRTAGRADGMGRRLGHEGRSNWRWRGAFNAAACAEKARERQKE